MTNIILCGANGKMGHVIQSVVNGRDDCKIVAGVDLNTDSSAFPVYSSFDEIKENADVIIDFSNPALLDSLLAYSKQQPVMMTRRKQKLKTQLKKRLYFSPII